MAVAVSTPAPINGTNHQGVACQTECMMLVATGPSLGSVNNPLAVVAMRANRCCQCCGYNRITMLHPVRLVASNHLMQTGDTATRQFRPNEKTTAMHNERNAYRNCFSYTHIYIAPLHCLSCKLGSSRRCAVCPEQNCPHQKITEQKRVGKG